MNTNDSELNTTFATKLAEALEDLKSKYDSGMSLHSDRNESSRRSDGKEACLEYMNNREVFKRGSLKRDSPVVFCMSRRYREFISRHYSRMENRFAEWFEHDWRAYLREECGVDNPTFTKGQIHRGSSVAARLTKAKVLEILVYELAYEKVISDHVAALKPHGTGDEPSEYVSEDVNRRRPGSFDRWESTAFFVTLIDALTRRHFSAEDEQTQSGNIHSLNIAKFAEAISKVTGLNVDNIRKDISDWRAGRVTDKNHRLRKVQLTLTSFGVEIDTTILEDAIERMKE